MGNIQTTRTHEIVTLHAEIAGHLRQSLEKAIRIGQLLLEQKDSLKHGKFTSWIRANLPFTDRTARNYMRLFREKDRLKTETVSDLKTAYALLTEPKQLDLPHNQEKISLVDSSIPELEEMISEINNLIKEEEHHVRTDTTWYEELLNQDGSMNPQECKKYGLVANINIFFCFYRNIIWQGGPSCVPSSVHGFITNYDDEPIDKKPRRICGNCHLYRA